MSGANRVELKQSAIREYLDNKIWYWRKQRECTQNVNEEVIAVTYIEAFQEMRMALFGEDLPE